MNFTHRIELINLINDKIAEAGGAVDEWDCNLWIDTNSTPNKMIIRGERTRKPITQEDYITNSDGSKYLRLDWRDNTGFKIDLLEETL